MGATYPIIGIADEKTSNSKYGGATALAGVKWRG